MPQLPASLQHHRVQTDDPGAVVRGQVRFAPIKSLWFTGMAAAAVVGGAMTFSWVALLVFMGVTGAVLLLGHSLGSHRKLIHDSYQCPKWLEYTLVYCGVQVGLAGPLGLLRQHELRDYAQRLPDCHPYLRHGTSFWRDAWWQIHCDLRLESPPQLLIEPRVANDRFYQLLERTWMAQQLVPAVLLFACGGWAFVFWGTCARVTAGILGHWLIGHFAHNRGGMHFEVQHAAVQGRNIRLTSLLTMGESWHNNHHAFPGSARLGLFPGEWDPGWWMLMVFRRLGWAWDFRLPADMPVRAELHARDDAAMIFARHLASPPARCGGLRQTMHLCLRGASPGDVLPTLQGPAATVPRSWMTRMAGPAVAFTPSAAATRLVLQWHGQQVQGLPALCVCLARRSRLGRAVAVVLTPLAVAFEGVRVRMDLS